ncbi:hypothetical protein Tco_0242652 [Tanacetum coccineum]
MFDESLNPQPYVDLHAPEVIATIPKVVAPEHVVSTGSPSSTTVDQDAPSPSNSHTTQATQTPIVSHDVEEENHDIEVSEQIENGPRSPIENIIGALDRPIEPKNYKTLLLKACWMACYSRGTSWNLKYGSLELGSYS